MGENVLYSSEKEMHTEVLAKFTQLGKLKS